MKNTNPYARRENMNLHTVKAWIKYAIKNGRTGENGFEIKLVGPKNYKRIYPINELNEVLNTNHEYQSTVEELIKTCGYIALRTKDGEVLEYEQNNTPPVFPG